MYSDALLGCTRQQVRLSAAECELYVQGSAPINPESESIPLERLLAALAGSFDAFSGWLHSNLDGLLEETPDGPGLSFGTTVAENFALLCSHDSYYAAQLAVLRELALSAQGE